jgi:signal-transduction protein with cAMP-binding, CBS, and nucleotidyltransferase domain
MPEIQSLLKGRPLVVLPATASALAAAQEMTRKNVGAVLVCGPDLRPQGIFTERDMLRRVVVPGLDPAKVTLADVMTRELYTVAPKDKIAVVRGELQARHVRHVPVVADGVALAMLSLRDMLSADLEQCSNDLHKTKLYIQGEAALD